MNPNFSVLIPARLHSTRLPQKMLLDVAGIPLVIRVALQAQKSNANRVVIATDHQDILDICSSYNITAILTSIHHQSGTERIAEAAEILAFSDDEIIINVQGDEPLISASLVNQLAEFTANKDAIIATIAHKICEVEKIINPNVVKTVLDNNDNALYFSRAPIPFDRNEQYRVESASANNIISGSKLGSLSTLKHVGIYAYRASFLRTYSKLSACAAEKTESLEQLRILHHGYKIAVMVTEENLAISVDTLDDLLQVKQILSK